MKKMLVVMMALAMVFAVTATTFAKDTVQVTLTSPAIVKKGCEKAGAVTFSFDAGSIITAGDWWYFDLPTNVTLCKTVDYFMVTGAVAKDETDFVAVTDHSLRRVTLNGGIAGVTAMAAGSTDGPFKVTNMGSGQPLVVAGGNVVFRVYGASGSQRVWVYAYGDTAGATITVGTATTFDISILDGQPHQTNILLNTDVVGASLNLWGDDKEDTIDTAVYSVPYVENTLCITAETYGGDLIFISLNSLDDQFTFTGDSQIAHVMTQNPLSLVHCDKAGATTGDILIGGQNACLFDYENPSGYCSTFKGNRIYLKGTTTFGDPGDSYDLMVTSDTAGVYFSATPAVSGFKPTDKKDCSTLGTAQGLAWTSYNEANEKNPVFPDSSCSVTSTKRVRKVMTVGGEIDSITDFDALWINLPNMYYDTSIIGNGIEAKVTITFSKYPCGVIFTGTVTVGTFVETCSVSGATTLLFPFQPAFDGSMPGWWSGFTIVNAGTIAGTAVLTFTELDGDKATFTTPIIAANGGMWVGDVTALLTGVTPATTNAGTFGDSNVAITAVCSFSLGGGFAFIGNGEEGVGYTAYVLGAAGWQ
ncbi:MAG: hypothetical protein V2B19_32805 [Pseudomonadota bacterium]